MCCYLLIYLKIINSLQINKIKDFFIENNRIFQNIKRMRILTLLYIVVTHFKICLNTRQIYSYICFCIKSIAKNLVPHRYVIWKGRGILITISDFCGYSFLIPYQNLTSYSSFKVSCNEHFETISELFILKISWSISHLKWIFYPCVIW